MASGSNSSSDHRKWKFNLNKTNRAPRDLTAPIGYSYPSDIVPVAQRDLTAIYDRKAWDVAKSPMKSIFTTAFMGWMMGSTLSIYSLFFIVFAFYNPLKDIFSVNSKFAHFKQTGKEQSFLPQKLVYILLTSGTLMVALYKISTMGMLPTMSDFLEKPTLEIPEQLSFGIITSY